MATVSIATVSRAIVSMATVSIATVSRAGRVLIAEWPVELRSQGMQHHVHLVDDGHRPPPHLLQLHRTLGLHVQRVLVDAAGVKHDGAEPEYAADAVREA